MRKEDQNPHVHRRIPDTSEHLRLSQLSDSARQDPSIISPECGGETCPGICASSPSRRVTVQITPGKILDT